MIAVRKKDNTRNQHKKSDNEVVRDYELATVQGNQQVVGQERREPPDEVSPEHHDLELCMSSIGLSMKNVRGPGCQVSVSV